MAILQKIRDKGLMTAIIVGGAIALFVLDPEGDGFNLPWGNNEENTVALSIFEEDADFFLQYSENIEIIKNQYPQESEGQRHEKAFIKTTEEAIVTKSNELLGLRVTEAELDELQTGSIRINNIHQAYPAFFSSVMERSQYLESAQQILEDINGEQRMFQPKDYEQLEKIRKIIRQESENNKFRSLIENSFYITSNEAKSIHLGRMQNSTVDYVKIPYAILENQVVNDDEVQEYYQKNIEKFKRHRETRDLEFITFPITPSLEDDLNLQQELSKNVANRFKKSNNDENFVKRYSENNNNQFRYFKSSDIFNTSSDNEFDPILQTLRKDSNIANIITKNNDGDVVGPFVTNEFGNKTYRLYKYSDKSLRSDSIRLKHIMLLVDRSSQLKLDSCRLLLSSLDSSLNSGADFNTLVMQYSADEASKIRGGDIGWIQENSEKFDFLPFVNRSLLFNDGMNTDTTFKLSSQNSQGEVFFHLFKITEYSKLLEKHKIVFLDRILIPSENTIENSYDDASKFLEDYSESTLDFREYAESNNMLVREDFNLHNMSFSISGLMQARDVVKWIYGWSGDVKVNRKVGDVVTVPLICTDNHVIASLSSINNKGNIPLEDVREQIISEIQKQKKHELLLNKQFASLADVSEEYQISIDSLSNINFDKLKTLSAENEPSLEGFVNSGAIGFSSIPVMGNNAIYFVNIKQRLNTQSPTDLQINNIKNSSIQQYNIQGKSIYESLIETIRRNSSIVDNRDTKF